MVHTGRADPAQNSPLLGPPKVGRLRRALGIPYPWSMTLAWPLRASFPALPKAGAFDALPAESPPAAAGALSVAFLGDVMATTPDLRLDVDPALRSVIAAADLVVLNCETPLAQTTRLRGVRFQLASDVFARHVEALGIRPDRLLVSLANNHSEDHGPQALADTARRIEDLGARVVGLRHGEADPITVIDARFRLGFCGWTHWRNRPSEEPAPRPWTAREVDRTDWLAARRDLALDALVGIPHWDVEFCHTPSPATRRFARCLLSGGFDLLFGHHPHVIQGIERVGRGLVCYSGGNAISTNTYVWPWAARLGIVLIADLSRDGRSVPAAYRVLPFVYRPSRSRAGLCALPATSVAPTRERRRFDAVFPPAT